ncbi:MAG: hypothetical protein K8F91_06170 [Candidatus Obscuribacterales bacterium]|nr:hypothetical protein [Candidatus Obscuribacterales bacterium]
MKQEKVGTIENVEIPNDWVGQHQPGSVPTGVSWQRIYKHRIYDDIEIVIKYRGVPIDEASRKVLNYLLKQEERDGLSVEEILALHTVMGVATTGDNQYTNHNRPGSLEGPHFQLDRIGIRNVSDKNVLAVEGRFHNGRVYKGVFYPAGQEGKVVEELFIQVPDKYDVESFCDEFDQLLGSIIWLR